MIKISIITTIYNSDTYLTNFVDMLKSQTYPNFEVLMINDGSTDNSEKIMNNITDKRFISVNKKNTGASDSRNIALGLVCGDFVTFIDSDDAVDKDYLFKIVNELKVNENSELIMLPYIRSYERKRVKVQLFEASRVFKTNNEISNLRRVLFGPINDEVKYPSHLENLAPTWGKVYKTELVKKQKFRVDFNRSEDLVFNIQFLKSCSQVSYIDTTFYIYNKTNSNSIVSSYDKNLTNLTIRLNSLLNKIIIDEHLGPDYQQGVVNRYVISSLAILRNIANSNLSIREKIDSISNFYSEYMVRDTWQFFELKKMGCPWRILFILIRRQSKVILLLLLMISEPIKKVIR